MEAQLEQFREDVYEAFPKRRDTLMDLLDALSSNTTARSVHRRTARRSLVSGCPVGETPCANLR